MNINNELAKLIIFRKYDADKYLGGKKTYYWLSNAQKKGLIVKIKRDMYAVVDVTTNTVYADKFMIASAITKTAYISYHSAFEYHGVANQVFSDVTVADSKVFKTFEYDGIEYSFVRNSINAGVLNIDSSVNIRVTDLERTVVDCIDDINLSGGIDELLNCIEQIRIIDENKIIVYLDAYNKVNLYQKAGYILEQYKNEFKFTNKIFEHCLSKLNKSIKYFLKDEFKEVVLNKKWRLIAPKTLRNRTSGGV